MREVFFALGSNLGYRLSFLQAAVGRLMYAIDRLRVSPIYETRPFGSPDQPQYLNAVAHGWTDLTPHQLLALAKEIERDLGRVTCERWGPREIDVDVLLVGSLTVKDETFNLPHPEMMARDFVLQPFVDLHPQGRHPISGVAYAERLAQIPATEKTIIRRFEERITPQRSDAFLHDPIPTWTDFADPSKCIEAFHKFGGVRIVDAVTSAEASSLLTAAQAVFALSEDEKRASLRQGYSSGYTPGGIEGVRNGPKITERCFWDVHSPDRETNLFPNGHREFATGSKKMFRTLEIVSMSFLAATYRDVSRLAINGRHELRFSSYQPSNEPHLQFPSHVDFGLITCYLGGAERGLQAEVDGRWVDVINPPGCVIFGAGTTLRLYDSAVVPFRHRVMSNAAPRVSAAFFTEPRQDVMLPSGVTAGEHFNRIMKLIRSDT